jgi:uncharacterized membrane protein
VHTENSIVIHAPVKDIFNLGARVEDWPHLLPHYRRVTVLRNEGMVRLVKMAATRDGIPVSWVSLQRADPEKNRIYYQHVRGITRGMTVEWIIDRRPEGVHVRIVHNFNPPWPTPLGPLIATYIVGRLFVHTIAGRTLRRIKRLAEEAPDAAPADVGQSAS